MCLYIGNKKPLVAKKDIVVYKYVQKRYCRYVTACQNYPIQTNKVLYPSHSSEDIVNTNFRKYIINGGVIHACTSSNDSSFNGYICLKAIIKEGTEFWVQDDFKQVAARSLYITDEVVTDKQTNIIDFCKMLIDEAPTNKDGIKIGDVLLADKTYVSPLKEFDKSKVIGYVACFNPQDDNPIHVGLNSDYLPFLTDPKYDHSYHSNIKYDKVEDDFDGYKHTYDIANAADYKADLFKAIDYCINYSTEGTNKGEWYLGATGEMIAIADNVIFINAAIMLVGIGEILNLIWSWTSSQNYDRHVNGLWDVRLINGCSTICQYWEYGSEDQVRPLIAFIKQAKRSYIKLLCNKLLNVFKV